MECLPTALAERLENGGTLGIFRAVVISEDFDLRNHVLVDIGNLRAHIAGIDQIRAVQHESHRPVWLCPIRRERAHRPVVRSTTWSLKPPPCVKPFVKAIPGMTFNNSPASRPTSGISSIIRVLSVVLISAFSSGTETALALTSIVSVVLPTSSFTPASDLLSPWLKTTAFSCQSLNPAAEMVMLYVPG